eukprot:TRINITY_DN22847_c0_g1_i2.p1 TRINITY_DN22847_c0_g1~~TRINITY_DN22847_c0_g1_i2.p1  ORF type:complete len:353 (+),score=72.17 TRINITY_DN22847_c0_g1_i2:81-1061(+)
MAAYAAEPRIWSSSTRYAPNPPTTFPVSPQRSHGRHARPGSAPASGRGWVGTRVTKRTSGASWAQQAPMEPRVKAPDYRYSWRQSRRMPGRSASPGAEARWRAEAAAFDRIDRNRDGVLSREEFQRAHREMAADAAFDRIDRNYDGVLSREELRAAQREAAAASAFDRMDRNRDGVVDREEFAAAMRERERAAADAAFDRIDRNRDGVISREEMWRAQKMAAADAAFDAMDRNHDGVVDRGEFLDAEFGRLDRNGALDRGEFRYENEDGAGHFYRGGYEAPIYMPNPEPWWGGYSMLPAGIRVPPRTESGTSAASEKSEDVFTGSH